MGGIDFDGGGLKKNHGIRGSAPPAPTPIRGNPAKCPMTKSIQI